MRGLHRRQGRDIPYRPELCSLLPWARSDPQKRLDHAQEGLNHFVNGVPIASNHSSQFIQLAWRTALSHCSPFIVTGTARAAWCLVALVRSWAAACFIERLLTHRLTKSEMYKGSWERAHFILPSAWLQSNKAHEGNIEELGRATTTLAFELPGLVILPPKKTDSLYSSYQPPVPMQQAEDNRSQYGIPNSSWKHCVSVNIFCSLSHHPKRALHSLARTELQEKDLKIA